MQSRRLSRRSARCPVGKVVPLDDVMESRVIGTTLRTNKYRMDWACKRCGRFGNIAVELSGGGRDDRGQMQPKTTDEELRRLLYEAHHHGDTTLIRCFQPTEQLIVGRLWRWNDAGQGRKTMSIIEFKDRPKNLDYHWPPRE